MIFIYGTKLAELQDRLFQKLCKGEVVSQEDIDNVNKNVWVSISYRIAPSNLVIRNQILSILLSNSDEYKSKKITRLNKALWLLFGKDILWQEGYSYWLYTKPFIERYAKSLEDIYLDSTSIRYLISTCDENFCRAGYTRQGVLYPPPFGDLRDQPIEECFQDRYPMKSYRAFPVEKSNRLYNIQSFPLGLNLHTSHTPLLRYNDNGVPLEVSTGKPIKWYEGYPSKYPHFYSELLDMLKLSRLKSAFKLLSRK